MFNFVYLKGANEEKTISFLELPVTEEEIKEVAKEMFNTEKPCIIQRQVCIHKINLQKQEKMSKLYKENREYNLKEIGLLNVDKYKTVIFLKKE